MDAEARSGTRDSGAAHRLSLADLAVCGCGHVAVDHHGTDPVDGCQGLAGRCRCPLACGAVLAAATAGYRYTLTRAEPATLSDPAGLPATLVWMMLNPSTADDRADDPTLRRVRAFTARLGYRQLLVVNLYAWRATRPQDLWLAGDPVGALNDQVITRAAEIAAVGDAPIIAGWGANAQSGRVADVLALPGVACRLHHLGPATQAGAPRHPLYLPSDAPLRRWAPAQC